MSPSEESSDSALRDEIARFRELVGAEAAAAALGRLQAIEIGDGDRLGDFRLRRELGRGGMGIVFEAEQISVPGRRVAVKVMRGLLATAAARTRFAREVEVIGRLDHPNIVPILAADVHGSTPYYAMKFIDGRSLRIALRDKALAGDWRTIAAIARDIARALQHVHEHGVVHRDVKPGNILLDASGRALLLDYGLAFLLDEKSDVTLSADAVGTPDYMAPEQVDRRFAAVTARTDVYGLGATLYECLAGGAPFAAESRHETMARIMRGDAAHPRAANRLIPADLANICAMAMTREPARRYPTAGEFAADLDAFLAHRTVQAQAPSLLHRTALRLRRHRLAMAACGLTLAGFVAAAAYWGWLRPARLSAELMAVVDDTWQRRDAIDRSLAAAIAVDRAQSARPPNMTLHEDLPARRLAMQRQREERARLDRELESSLEACVAFDPVHAGARDRYAAFLALQLRDLLGGGGIVSRREEIARCEQRLRRFAAIGEHESLLRTSSQLAVTCAAGTAQAWLCPAYTAMDGRVLYAEASDPAAVALGTTPASVDVAEGNYALRARRDGCVDIVLPLLLRRAAVQTPAEKRVELEFMVSAEVGEGYRQIHGGHGVVVDRRKDAGADQDELQYQPSFLITEREVGLDEYLRWTHQAPSAAEQQQLAEHRLIHNLEWNDVLEKLTVCNEQESRSGTGWYTGLPTPEEFARAGQGADGRPYPWGWIADWRFSQNYWSTIDSEQTPDRTRWPAEDCSPFGVRDLAGSLREVCLPARPLQDLGTKQFLVLGGSYLSTYSLALQLTSLPTLPHGDKAFDTGLRFVRRPLPPVPKGSRGLQLADTLRPAAATTASGWQLAGLRGPLREDIDFAERCEVRAAELLVHGFAHWFSPSLLCWHPVTLATDEFTTTIEFTCRRTVDLERSIELRVGTQPGFEAHDRVIACRVTNSSWSLLADGVEPARGTIHAADGNRLRLRVDVSSTSVHAELAVGSAPPTVLQVQAPARSPAPRAYVGVMVPNLVGMTVSIHALEVAEH